MKHRINALCARVIALAKEAEAIAAERDNIANALVAHYDATHEKPFHSWGEQPEENYAKLVSELDCIKSEIDSAMRYILDAADFAEILPNDFDDAWHDQKQ
jgi:hypothetical protein